MLKNTLELLPEFDHTVVYIYPGCDLGDEMAKENIELICLEHKKSSAILFTIFKLRKIILEKKPVLVHSHLFYSTVCARLATPSSVPLVSTIHSVYGHDVFNNNLKGLLAAKLTLKKRHSLIGVSHYVLEDYFNYIKFRGKHFVLHNFLPDSVFQYFPHTRPAETIKMVAVGNLKEAKNYGYLLQVLKHLKNVSLDIYGSGDQQPLKKYIETENLNVRLCGSTNRIPDIFRDYDYFIQASLHEGFGLSVIEAMGAGIPVLLSDIPVFREITNNWCHFFPLNNPLEAAAALADVFNSNYPDGLAKQAFDFVRENYSATEYRKKLLLIYETVCGRNLLEEGHS